MGDLIETLAEKAPHEVVSEKKLADRQARLNRESRIANFVLTRFRAAVEGIEKDITDEVNSGRSQVEKSWKSISNVADGVYAAESRALRDEVAGYFSEVGFDVETFTESSATERMIETRPFESIVETAGIHVSWAEQSK